MEIAASVMVQTIFFILIETVSLTNHNMKSSLPDRQITFYFKDQTSADVSNTTTVDTEVNFTVTFKYLDVCLFIDGDTWHYNRNTNQYSSGRYWSSTDKRLNYN